MGLELPNKVIPTFSTNMTQEMARRDDRKDKIMQS